MELNLYENGKKLDPLEYSTGKTQTDVVNEVLEAFEDNDVVVLDGKVGSGKSVIGIRTAIEMGGGIISVPTKVLSDQYFEDYYKGNMYFEDRSGNTVEVSVFKGRSNFQCPYMKRDNPNLDDWRVTAQNRDIPCSRTLEEEESRLDAIKSCPWGATLRKDGLLREEDRESFPIREPYRSIGEYGTVVMKEKPSGDGPRRCPYWEQYLNYPFSDIMAMNSAKFKIEARIGRLPNVPLVVIDEEDAFLDNVCSKVVLSERRINSLKKQIDRNISRQYKAEMATDEVDRIWRHLMQEDINPYEAADSLIKVMKDLDYTESLMFNLMEIMEYKGQSYFEDKRQEQDNPKIVFYLANPRPILRNLIGRLGAKVLLMSATPMSQDVHGDIFGIHPTKVVGEPSFPGVLVEKKTGRELNVVNDNWKEYDFRQKYAEVRDEMLREMKRPAFVPVHATKYLPDVVDGDELKNKNMIEVDGIHFSTKMDRGSDLGKMESVGLLKYPYPYMGDPLLQAMKKNLGDKKYWKYYNDMARREFIQQIGRIMRSPDARKEFWSPDINCHQKLRSHWSGDITTP